MGPPGPGGDDDGATRAQHRSALGEDFGEAVQELVGGGVSEVVRVAAVSVVRFDHAALAAFEGKRLPTSLEWEAAARGTDGRLFPWGDTPDLDAVNCADTWAGRPLVTYQACKEEFDRGGLGHAWVTPVDARPSNRSPYGIADMVGNVWEWTSTSVGDPDEAVICGGAFDNPLCAGQASAKGLFRRSRASNAVGLRCVTELSPTTGDDVKEDPQP